MEKKEKKEKQVKEKNNLPKEKKKSFSIICDSALSAIIAYVYFIFLELGSKNIHPDIYITDLRVFAVSLCVVAIIFFEKAYKDKTMKQLCRGIEVFVLAILTLFLQYVILYLPQNYRVFIPLLGVAFNIYYVLKTLAWIVTIKRKDKKSKSDIKEIVKGEEK